MISKNLQETRVFAENVLHSLASSYDNPREQSSYDDDCSDGLPRQGAAVIGLSGDLGAGKTTFVQQAALVLGIEETVTSPTFVIEKIYPIPEGGAFKRLIHIDAYRIEKEEELLRLNWSEIINDPENLVMIEWPENVAGIMPEGYVKILFEVVGEGERKMYIES